MWISPRRKVCFFSDTQIEMAEKAESLFLDGTFSTCPAPYKQLLILRGKIDSSVHTLAYALLPDKKEKTYSDVLKEWKAICSAKGKPLDFLFCHSDCERAILNAVTRSFPNVNIRVCHFHVADAIRRHCSSLGLTRLIRSNKNFQAFYERCRNIFYFPSHLWPELWKKMKSSLSPSMQRHSGVAKFIEYMEANWI